MAKGKKPHLVALDGGKEAFIPHEAAKGSAREAANIDPPEFIMDDTLAMAEWRRVVPLLIGKGILDELDTVRLGTYCLAVSEFTALTLELRREGFTYQSKGRNGVQIKNKPSVGRRNELIKIIHSCASDFGLSPLARMRLAVGEQDDLFSFMEKLQS